MYYGRGDCHNYLHSHEEIMQKYGDRMAMTMRMSKAISPAMGDQSYTIHAYTEKEKNEFLSFVSALK